MRILKTWILFLILAGTAAGQNIDEGIKQFNSGNTAKAFQKIYEYYRDHREDPRALYYLGRLDPQGENSLSYLNKVVELSQAEGLDSVLPSEVELSHIVVSQYYYSVGLYITSLEVLKQFMENFLTSTFMPQALYLSGMCKLASDQIPAARKDFGTVLSSFGNTNLALWAKLGLADCYFAEKNYGSAEAEYKEVLYRYAASEAAPVAISQLSRCYSELKDDSQALFYFNLLAEKSPQSSILPAVPISIQIRDDRQTARILNIVYTVQLGVFGQEASVRDLVYELRTRGLSPRTFTKKIQDKKYVVVQVGEYRTMQEAKTAKESLEQDLGGSYRVVMKE